MKKSVLASVALVAFGLNNTAMAADVAVRMPAKAPNASHPLNYREEKILETFYALAANKGTTLTFDYEFIADPAYNADRGPVPLFAARLHAEF